MFKFMSKKKNKKTKRRDSDKKDKREMEEKEPKKEKILSKEYVAELLLLEDKMDKKTQDEEVYIKARSFYIVGICVGFCWRNAE